MSSSLLQLNHGFFFTVKELFIRPGHSIREFLSGKRVRHYKPIAFLLLTSTIYVLSAYFMERNTFIYDVALGFEEGASAKNKAADQLFVSWMTKYQVYIPLLILPLFSFCTYIAFIRYKYNYFEHLVINFYITGQQMIIYFVMGFLLFKENILMITPIVLGIAYKFWTFSQLFEHKRRLSKIGLIVLAYILFLMISFAILFALAGLLNIFGWI